jgi:GntR family phosphonate transport system transcriptional regulator
MSLYLVDRERGGALHAQIARQLEQEIGQVYGLGAWLPPETELALRFGVNRHTVRRAIDHLVDGGLLDRRHGRGNCVIGTLVDYPIGSATRFTETLQAQGIAADTRVLHKQIIPANSTVACRLKLGSGEQVYWIETLRHADGLPLCVGSHFLPAERFRQVGDLYEGGSLHQHLQDLYSVAVRRTECLVTAKLPQGDDARLLSMPRNRPVLRIKSLNVDAASSVPVEYVVSRFRADAVQLSMKL